ncbi:MAG: hypothetical protein FJW96_14185 [Actinobacteria bacterium]|nr:hypothetical protein [Actinomycetota bacterium]
MADSVQRIADVLSAPMEQVIVALGRGVARAQQELDRHALETEREISEDPLLAEAGLHATFYQIPRAELDLSIAIAMEEEPGTRALGAGLLALKQIHLQPVNATYKNQFDYDVQAASRLKLTMVPVPPPAADVTIPSRLTREKVLELAKEKLVDASDARLAVNFNPQARTWFVLQYRFEGNAVKRLALVVVDDETAAITKAVTEGSG